MDEAGPQCREYSPVPQNRPHWDRNGGASLSPRLCRRTSRASSVANRVLGKRMKILVLKGSRDQPLPATPGSPKHWGQAGTTHLPILYSSGL